MIYSCVVVDLIGDKLPNFFIARDIEKFRFSIFDLLLCIENFQFYNITISSNDWLIHVQYTP